MTGNEHLLPAAFRKKIPYTTISHWRKTDYGEYLGHEFRYFFNDAFQNAELKYNYYRLKKGMKSLAKAWMTMSSVIKPVFKSAANDKARQKTILKTIQYISEYLGLKRTLKMIGISRTLYQQWLLEARFTCFDSYTALCMKRHPHQLSVNEIEKMKALLDDPEYAHWPIVSIASFAFRNQTVEASLYSWYKFARIEGYYRKLVKKDLKTIGLIATRPNEYIHVDTTHYPLNENRKIFITFAMDNYSKAILGWHIHNKCNYELVEKALRKAVQTIRKHPDNLNPKIVTDGGRENNNKQIDQYIQKISDFKLKKIIALKDIRFSNSPVEAIHKIIKGRYLRNRTFDSIRSLNKFLMNAVHDYNELRPHYKHRPRTPFEVYFNIPLGFDIRTRVKQAVQQRVIRNRNVKCLQCKDRHTCTKPCNTDN
jgi:putative transposase